MGELEIVCYKDALENIEWQIWRDGAQIATFDSEEDAKEYCHTGGTILQQEHQLATLRDENTRLRKEAEDIATVAHMSATADAQEEIRRLRDELEAAKRELTAKKKRLGAFAADVVGAIDPDGVASLCESRECAGCDGENDFVCDDYLARAKDDVKDIANRLAALRAALPGLCEEFFESGGDSGVVRYIHRDIHRTELQRLLGTQGDGA